VKNRNFIIDKPFTYQKEFLKSYSYLTEKEYDLTKIKEMNDEC